jgi:hypothetical protein
MGECPFCKQGSLVPARERSTGHEYILCDECECEWEDPELASNSLNASNGKYGASDLLTNEDLINHVWLPFFKI